MAISRRDVKAERSQSRGRLRHPLLKLGSTHLHLYNYIKEHPHCLARDTKHIEPHPQPLSTLVQEGLVKAHGKIPRTYTAVPENATGKPRDKVEVEVTILVNRFGEFSAECALTGQKPTATQDFPQVVAKRTILVPVPHPDDPFAIREIVDINDRPEHPKANVYTQPSDSELIIDAEWTEIK